MSAGCPSLAGMMSERDLAAVAAVASTGPAAADVEPEPLRLSALTSLSPSRASDFMTCPLLYRFRVVDRLPERPSVAAVRGSVVHKVLEELFDLPSSDRTLERA